MAKRKAPTEELPEAPAPRRSSRSRKASSRTSPAASPPAPKAPPKKATSKATKKPKKEEIEENVKPEATSISKKAVVAQGRTSEDAATRQYWLMKAEPETRMEKGVDVKFSIDDLKAKTEPEPWDGIRNYVARNNLRAMKKGDIAFFWHSNCKEPGIVGTMEIVHEHSPDLSAHDPKAAYYDPKSSPDDPKWSVVHVEFRRKVAVPVTLKELREHAQAGGPLAQMQMMKQSRLSVSRVGAEEWEFLMGLVEEKEEASKE